MKAIGKTETSLHPAIHFRKTKRMMEAMEDMERDCKGLPEQ